MYEFSQYREIIDSHYARIAVWIWNSENMKLRFPRSIDELRSSTFVFPRDFKNQFGLFSEQPENHKYHYKVYAFGFDNDDDKCAKVYDLSLKNILIPFIDGDILLSEDTFNDEKLTIFYPDKSNKNSIYQYNRYNIPDSLVRILKPFD